MTSEQIREAVQNAEVEIFGEPSAPDQLIFVGKGGVYHTGCVCFATSFERWLLDADVEMWCTALQAEARHIRAALEAMPPEEGWIWGQMSPADPFGFINHKQRQVVYPDGQGDPIYEKARLLIAHGLHERVYTPADGGGGDT